MIKRIVMMVAGAALIVSCGGGGEMGGTVQYNTVYLKKANTLTGPLDADLAEWETPEDPCGEGNTFSISPDFIPVNLSTSVYPGKPSNNPSSVFVDYYTVRFQPIGNAPPLDPYTITVSQAIPPGGQITVNAQVASREVKNLLGQGDADLGIDGILCAGLIEHKYYVIIRFHTVEVGGPTREFDVTGTVFFSDYDDNLT